MEGLDTYVLSVAAGAVASAIAVSLVGKKGAATVIRLVCGVMMASIVIRPFGDIIVTDLSDYYFDLNTQVSQAVNTGSEQAYLVLSQRITEQTQAYILDKAAELDLVLEVEVILDDSTIPVPVRVVLRGNASPSARNALTEMIIRDFGIGKEDQIWS